MNVITSSFCNFLKTIKGMITITKIGWLIEYVSFNFGLKHSKLLFN